VSFALPALLSLGAVTLVDWRPIQGSQAAPWSVDRPVPAPIVFGEGTISTSHDEMDAAFTADGRSVYFTKNHFGQRLGVILRSDFASGRWSEPVVAPVKVRAKSPRSTPLTLSLKFARNVRLLAVVAAVSGFCR